MRQEKNKRKTVCVIGHFGGTKLFLDGQTIKTKTITEELERQLGADNVGKIDTYGGMKRYFSLPFQLLHSLKKFNNIVILPAQRGLRIIAPLITFFNIFFHRKLFYCVIGGWLPKLLDEKKGLKKVLLHIDKIFVETNTMCKALVDRGFCNIDVMPNCKSFETLKEKDLVYCEQEPYKLCTFSRVMREKGIEDAIEAVKAVNNHLRRPAYVLDIYGPIDSGQIEWFQTLQNSFPEYICYRGSVPSEKAISIIKEYFALLFPTRFYTEGIPGTIIDAYAAGVPVIASKWENFDDVIDDGKSGIGYSFGDCFSLKNVLLKLLSESQVLNDMKITCLDKAHAFEPHNVLGRLIQAF